MTPTLHHARTLSAKEEEVKRKTQDMCVTSVERIDAHRSNAHFGLFDDDASGPWLTVDHATIGRAPKVGDVLRIELPRVVKLVETKARKK